jgi:hypothetical protein
MTGIRLLVVLLLSSLVCTFAHATTVTYIPASLGGNEYE